MSKKTSFIKYLGIHSHRHLVTPLILLIIILVISTIIVFRQTTSIETESVVSYAATEPSCQLTINVPQSVCNEPCQIDSDCTTGYCYQQHPVLACTLTGSCPPTTGVCRSKTKPADSSCSQTTGRPTPKSSTPTIPITPMQPCRPRPECLDATPRCLIAEPENGWCPPADPIPTPPPDTGWWQQFPVSFRTFFQSLLIQK